MSKEKIYQQALQTKTLITQTLVTWSSLLLAIIAFVKMDDWIKLLLSVFTSVLIVATIVCVKRWVKLLNAYSNALKCEQHTK